MADLDDLYQELILDHTKHPRNFRKLEAASHKAVGDNPLCGDRVAISLKIDNGLRKRLCHFNRFSIYDDGVSQR